MTKSYSIDKPLRVVELFAGIGAQAQALENLGIPYTSTVCEIDKRAYESYCAIHGDTPNLGDITKVEHLPECDLLTYSFPCQDLSIAGCRGGMQKGSGTRSALLWEVGRLLEDLVARGVPPKTLVMENVSQVHGRKNLKAWNEWLGFLTSIGYVNSWSDLNATSYGVPQNRIRCFMVSSRSGRMFRFPEGIELNRCLMDILEDDVDESYYLSDERVEKYQRIGQRDHATTDVAGVMTDTDVIQAKRVYDSEGIAPSVTAGGGTGSIIKIEEPFLKYPTDTRKGYMEAHEGDGLVMMRPMKARGTVQIQKTPTLTTGTGCGTGVVVKDAIEWPTMTKMLNATEGDGIVPTRPYSVRKSVQDHESFAILATQPPGVCVNDGIKLRIRYLTPRECWRLMGFSDEAFSRAKSAGMPKTQLYKQAGNSIVVNVLEAIFRGMFIDNTWEIARSLEAWL